MKRIIVSALLVLVSACAFLPTDGGGEVVDVEEEFTLAEGRTALVLRPRIAVEFVEVTEDTRCPIEALCISGGGATVRLRVAREGLAPAVLDLRTDDPSESTEVYGSHAVQLLGIDPPRSVHEPDPDYRVHLRVYPVYDGN